MEATRKELPALDDALAAEVGDFETLEALRERVRTDLREEAERRAKDELRGRLIREIVESNPFEVPDSMVDRYVSFMLGEDPDEARKRKQTPEREEQISQFRALVRPQAEAAAAGSPAARRHAARKVFCHPRINRVPILAASARPSSTSARRPAALMASTVVRASRSSTGRWTIATSAPSRAKSTLTARPMPESPPVTRATRLSSLPAARYDVA